MGKPQLVLDIGGVLASNLTPGLWRLLALESAVTEQELYAAYKRELSERLWTGELSEEQFWSWMSGYLPGMTIATGRSYIVQSLRPLPALDMLQQWHEAADIHILSNHLPAWVETVVEPNSRFWSSVTISSETGFRKPHPAIFQRVSALLPRGSKPLFVDDQEKNIRQAASLGWRTLLADEEGNWIREVLPLLQIIRDQDEQ
ncbi:HAD-IA family hydrolase [Paenibacillus sp. N4]|uniref:HAD family hydrolase n=1 Tax=Paenibacillus vietnamensis TaxID=2590547 RepID=UPI001CD0D4AF|nr:HAD-IA family hydrolase [Paenibacillus vietnamensis]MCA0754122.1 HAD-IA family hydrolase [Paenibacillus vietnamensis]